MRCWIGTSGFQYPEWKGTFYPEKMPVSKMLPYYAERFSTTEINYSFRRIPSPKTVAGWVAATPKDFRFTFKAPQKVTHFAKLRECGAVMNYFDEIMAGLGVKRGLVLCQLPPTFAKDAAVLRTFLESLPKTLRATFEFRHTSWFDEEVYAALRDHEAALCLAESADLTTPQVITASFGSLRLRREDYTAADLEKWAFFIQQQREIWEEVFIYFKHEAAGVGPKFAAQLQRLLNL